MTLLTEIKFYSGMRTIGGTVIEVLCNQDRLIFDFGYIMNHIFDDQLKPRTGRELQDKLTVGMIPRVEGIFPKEMLIGYPLESYEESNKNTIFYISHMHLDHMASLSYIHPNIPIYVSQNSQRLYRAMAATGEEIPLTNLVGTDYGVTIKHGDISLTIEPIDHDVPGASGLLIETPDGHITYTGDLRFHGFHPDLTFNFIEKAIDTDVLITEGVTISFIDDEMVLEPIADLSEESLTEMKLQEELATMLKECDGTVFINFYHRNIERIKGLVLTALNAGRKLVLERDTAKLMEAFDMTDDYLIYDISISSETIKSDPNQYLVQMSYPNSLNMTDMNLEKALYIHSNGAPLGDYDPSYAHLMTLLEQLSVEVAFLPCGGHAGPNQLKYLVETIKPKTLVPYHSFAPERMTYEAGERVLPVAGDVYRLENGRLNLIERMA